MASPPGGWVWQRCQFQIASIKDGGGSSLGWRNSDLVCLGLRWLRKDVAEVAPGECRKVKPKASTCRP
eukprot:s90_g35.t1